MKESQNIITAENLSAGYKNNIVWSNANFTITKGEFVAILGPNGAGKTTLFRQLLGLSKPMSGKIAILGESPHRGNSRVGYVPQRHTLNNETAIESLELVRLGLSGKYFGLGNYKQISSDRAEAMKVLELVGAKDLAHKPIGTLSGGEAQRVFLAEAIIGNPELLLLDEPLANLDIRYEQNLVHLIHDIVHKRGVTVLLIAHNINPLLPVLDRVMYVANGKITSGRPEDVLTSESLTSLYGTPVEVLRDSLGRIAVLGIEEEAHHHDDKIL